MILLAFLPAFAFSFFKKFKTPLSTGAYVLLTVLIAVQWGHFLWFKTMWYSEEPTQLESYIKKEILPTDKTVGVIDLPSAAAVLPAGRYFQFIQFIAAGGFGSADGVNALDLPNNLLPTYLIYQKPFFVLEGDLNRYQKKMEAFSDLISFGYFKTV